MTKTELRIMVLGKPAPKGSLKSYGRGRMVEQLAASAPWRAKITAAAIRARQNTGWEMLTGPVSVTCRAVTPRPKTVRREYPITRSSGDADKLARNLLDALVDARIMHDDSQVVHLEITKVYPGVEPGMYITVRPFFGPVNDVVNGDGKVN